jgi:hypothetical protein
MVRITRNLMNAMEGADSEYNISGHRVSHNPGTLVHGDNPF